MSTPPHHPSTKVSRRSGRKTRNYDHVMVLHSNGVMSDNDLPSAQAEAARERKASGRRPHAPPGSANRQYIPSGSTSDVATERASATPTKGTPMKAQAYAGATFTNSPAASALPMPSFYSRSVPNVSQLPPRPGTADLESKPPSPPLPLQDGSPSKQGPSPLDFLFNAARQARAAPQGQSPSANSSRLSVGANTPQSHSPAPRDHESVFPFELDGAATPGEESDSFSSPSYRERIAALRNTPSVPTQTRDRMSEAERLEKTAALKKLLVKENTPSPSSESMDMSNPFNAKAPKPHPYPTPSNPPARSSSAHATLSGNASASPSRQPNGHAPFSPPLQLPPYFPNNNYRQGSGLRHHIGPFPDPEPTGLSADPAAVISPRIPNARIASHSGLSARPEPTSLTQAPGHKSKPSIAQMEEQMRTFLKLDVASKG